MKNLNTWLQGIIISVIIATIIEMILPNGSSKKYVKIVLGIYIVFNIITPIVNLFSNSNFEISSIINIEKYTDEMSTYEVSTESIEETNANNIKQIYINKLKEDMLLKLKEKNYCAKNIEIEIESDDTYKIKNIDISVEKLEEKEKEENTINKIEKVEIQIGKRNENVESNNNITKTEKDELISYLASVYELQEKQIRIN